MVQLDDQKHQELKVLSWIVKESDRKLSSLMVVRSRSKSECYHLMIKQIRRKAYQQFCSNNCSTNCDEMCIPKSCQSDMDLDLLIAEQGWFDPLPSSIDLTPMAINDYHSERGFPDLVLDAFPSPQVMHAFGSILKSSDGSNLKSMTDSGNVSNHVGKCNSTMIDTGICNILDNIKNACEKENLVIPMQEPQPTLLGMKPEKRKRLIYEDMDIRLRKDSGIDDCF